MTHGCLHYILCEASLVRLTNSLSWKAQKPVEAWRCARCSRLGNVRASRNFATCAGRWVLYESLSEPWCVCLSLTWRCTIALRNSCAILLGLYPGCGMHHSSDKHLTYIDGRDLDCCEVTAITSDFNMTTITLDNHYYVLSCQPAPPDALSVPCGH
jgi:hypothetical protein